MPPEKGTVTDGMEDELKLAREDSGVRVAVASFQRVSRMNDEIDRGFDQETNEDVADESDHPFTDSNWKNAMKAINDNIRGSYLPSEKGTILRVPDSLRNLDRKAYEPRVVSIGPYHYSDCRFQETKKHKWRSLNRFLQRTGHSVETCFKRVLNLERRALCSYSSSFDMTTREGFAQMMLVDACFIIELFRVWREPPITDPIFSSRGLVPYIQRDLLLLENQLPFFVLDELFSATHCEEDAATLVELALEFFNSAVPVDTDASNIKDYPLHLLHLVQQALLPSEELPTSNQNSCQPQRSVFPVTVLRECGVKFRKEKFDKLTNIEFDKRKGVLKISPFKMHDSTKLIFLNLMVFEQCHPRFGNHFTSYLLFMDRLINSSQDVSHLCRKEIIDNCLGNEDDVANFFNSLSREIAIDFNVSYFEEVARDVNQYAQKKRHGWMAILMHEYFRNPWAIITLFVATVILLFAATQTFFTVFPSYVPSSH